MAVEEQVVVIFAGTKGYLDDIPASQVKRFEADLIEYVRGTHGGLLEEIKSSGVPDDLTGAIESFKEQFDVSGDDRVADPTATDADELGDAKSQKTLATE